jgi:hypothetical protein
MIISDVRSVQTGVVQSKRAFDDLPEPVEPLHDWPRYFLLCHAIELALKAYLAYKGATYGQLKGFKHNLTELVTRATQEGLSLTQATQMAIDILHEAHSKFWHRYPTPEGGPWSFPTIAS